MGTKKPLLFPKSGKTAEISISGNKSLDFVPKIAFPGTELLVLFPRREMAGRWQVMAGRWQGEGRGGEASQYGALRPWLTVVPVRERGDVAVYGAEDGVEVFPVVGGGDK